MPYVPKPLPRRDDPTAERPRGLLPDADAIDKLVIQAAKTLAIYEGIGLDAAAIIKELRAMLEKARQQGGITVTIRPTGEFILTIPFPKEE